MLVLPALAFGQVTLQEWTFDDANGTTIGESLNSGSPGDWGFSEGLTDQQAAVTDGALRLLGASTGDGIINSLTTGESVFTNGIYEFSFSVSDFDMTGAGTLGWAQILLKSGGANLVIFRLQESPSETLRIWLNSGAGGQFFPLTGSNISNGGTITISGSINLDEQTITCSIDSPNDEFDVASTGPLAFLNTGDLTGFQLASQLTTSTTAASDFLDISEIRLTGPEVSVEPATWAGYEVDENGWADTSGFMSWINVFHAPWVWSTALDRWLYMPEESVSESGGWAYAGK